MSSKKHMRAFANEHNTTHEHKKVKRNARNETNKTHKQSVLDTQSTVWIPNHSTGSGLNPLKVEREITRTCRAFGFTKQEIDDSVRLWELRPYATTAQWIFITIFVQGLVDDSSNLDYILFREAFDTYPGSPLQIQLHTLMDNSDPSEYNIKRRKGESRYSTDEFFKRYQDDFSDVVWASVIAFVLFHDTYKSSTDESLNSFLRYFWKRMYRNIYVVNEAQILAGHGFSVDDVFHDDMEACWRRGLNSRLNSYFLETKLQQVFTTQCNPHHHSNPKVLDALLKYFFLKDAAEKPDEKPDDISCLRDDAQARQFWDVVCEQMTAWLEFKQLTASEVDEDDCLRYGPLEGPWRAFSYDFRDEHGNVLPMNTDRVCYAFQWLSKEVEPYLIADWQIQANKFVVFHLSIIEQEVLVMWSRISSIFRPGFAPSVPANSTLDVFSGISQPIAYDMLDAIFEREDISRITSREGMWVYRGIHGLHENNTSTVQMASSQFISTTYIRDVATSFSTKHDSTREPGLLLKIWLPPGTPFILLDAFNHSEHEILLPRNHELRPYVVSAIKEKNTAHFRFVYKRMDDQSSVNEVASTLERNLSLRSNQRKVVRQQRDILQQQLRAKNNGQNDGRAVVFTCRVLQYLRCGRKLFAMTFEEQMIDMLDFLEKEQEQDHKILSHATQLISNLTNESWFILLEDTSGMSSMGLHIRADDMNFWPLYTFYPQNLPGLCVQFASNYIDSGEDVHSLHAVQRFQRILANTLHRYVLWWQNSPPTFAIDKAFIPSTREEWRHVFRQARSMSAFRSIRVHTVLSKMFHNQALLDSLVS